MAGAVEVLRIHQEQEVLGRRDTMVEIATTREQEAVVWGLRVKVPCILQSVTMVERVVRGNRMLSQEQLILSVVAVEAVGKVDG